MRFALLCLLDIKIRTKSQKQISKSVDDRWVSKNRRGKSLSKKKFKPYWVSDISMKNQEDSVQASSAQKNLAPRFRLGSICRLTLGPLRFCRWYMQDLFVSKGLYPIMRYNCRRCVIIDPVLISSRSCTSSLNRRTMFQGLLQRMQKKRKVGTDRYCTDPFDG